MTKARKTLTESTKEDNLSQFYDESIRNYIKARYLNLVSQTSATLDEKIKKDNKNASILYENERTHLIAADLALQYLQKRNMSLTLDSASSESQNLLTRHFEDRWLARTLQVRGKQDVLHGLILSKKNNTFDIGFGPNFVKNKREQGGKKSSSFRSKSLPSDNNNLLATLKELDEEKQNKNINNNLDVKQKEEKQLNESQYRKGETSLIKHKKTRRSYQGHNKNRSQHYSSQTDNYESQHNSPEGNNSEFLQYSSQIEGTESQHYSSIKNINDREIKNDEEPDSPIDESDLYNQSQKTDNESENKSPNDNTSISNILPSPLKTTYSGRESDEENGNVDDGYGTDDEMKTHTYEYSTIYSNEELTHETFYEYETLTQQSIDDNDFNSKTYEDSYATDISSQKQKNENNNNHSSKRSNKYTESASASPKINPSTSYEYYPSYSISDEKNYSNKTQQKQSFPSQKAQKPNLELQFPFIQSRNGKKSQNDEQCQNSKKTQPKHEDYYSRKHSKGQRDKLIFSNPVEFSNPGSFIESSEENEGHIAAMKREAEVYQDEPEIICEEEEEESDIQPTNKFFIFHAVDIKPDYKLQKVFKSQAKRNKELSSIKKANQKNNISEVNERAVLLDAESSSNNHHIDENIKGNRIKKINISCIEKGKNNNSASLEELINNIDSTTQNQKGRPSTKDYIDNDVNNPSSIYSLYISSESSYVSISSSGINKAKHHQHYHKRQHHGSIRKGSQLIDRIKSKSNKTTNNNVNEREVKLDNEIKNKSNELSSSGVSSLIIPPSSSSPFSILSSSDHMQDSKNNNSSLITDDSAIGQHELNDNEETESENHILNDKNRKTKFSHKLESSKIDNQKNLNKQSSSSSISLKKSKKVSSSMETIPLDVKISDSSTLTSIAKICESISEDELMEMSDASPASFD